MRDGAHRAYHDQKAHKPDSEPEARDEEARIFACLARGDRRGAETELFLVYGARILARCVRMLRQQSTAEDIAQQVLLEACRDLDRFERRASLHTWLCRIARHRCLDAIKARRAADKYVESEGEVTFDAPDPGATQDAQLDRARLRVALEECLQELPAAVAETVRLRFQNEDLSYEEMAAVMNVSPGTLNQRVIRALPQLAKCLESKGWAHE